MTLIVNLFVLGLLGLLLFQTAMQGLLDFKEGLTGTIVFSSIIVLYLVVIIRMIIRNIMDRRSQDSMVRFFDHKAQYKFRGRPDRVVKSISWIGTACWGILVTVLVTIKNADITPEIDSTSDTYINFVITSININTTWNSLILVMTILMSLLSAFGLFLKSKRNKRAVDRYPPSLITMFVISCLGTLFFS